MNQHIFGDAARAGVYAAIEQRRDIREFVPGEIAPEVLQRLLLAAHAAPSVGYMQPWRMVRISDRALRQKMIANIDAERQRTAAALPTRGDEFLQLKVHGVDQCAEVLVMALMDGCAAHVFGRRTLPEMALASAACAIQNLWLAARAEGLGLGWVSIFDPVDLKQLLAMPADAQPIAILCLGPAREFPEKPLLEKLGWGSRLPLDQVVFENQWPTDAKPTPTAY